MEWEENIHIIQGMKLHLQPPNSSQPLFLLPCSELPVSYFHNDFIMRIFVSYTMALAVNMNTSCKWPTNDNDLIELESKPWRTELKIQFIAHVTNEAGELWRLHLRSDWPIAINPAAGISPEVFSPTRLNFEMRRRLVRS